MTLRNLYGMFPMVITSFRLTDVATSSVAEWVAYRPLLTKDFDGVLKVVGFWFPDPA